MSAHPRFLLTAALVALTLAGGCQEREDAAAPSGAEAAAAPATGPIEFGVLPAVSKQQTVEMYGPLVKHLADALGRQVKLHVAESYGDLLGKILSGKVQLAQVSAHLYVSSAVMRARANKQLQVVAQEKRPDNSRYTGVFVVPRQSKAKTIADLAGRSMSYVDDSSTSGYIYPRIKLRNLNHDPDSFFGETSFAGSHDAVIAAVKGGKAEAGAVSEQSASLSGLRVLERTDPIPDDAIIALGGISDAELAKLRSLFLGAANDPKLANFFVGRGIEKYVAASIEVYDAQKDEMMKTGSLDQEQK